MLKQIKHLILDMDGVLWRGDTPIGDLPRFFERIERLGIRAVFATNNASKTPQQYIAKFGKMGVTITAEQVMSSAIATADYLANEYGDRAAEMKVYVIGLDGLIQALEQNRFTILERFDSDTPADLVTVGFNTDVTYWDFAAATHQMLKHGARFIGCNPDKAFPTERGLLPGNGSLLALLETATGFSPTIIGKPYPHMFEAALRKFGPSAGSENTMMIGDRVETDIQGGQGIGLPTGLVMSGVSTPESAAASDIKPSLIIKDIHDLADRLEAEHAT